MPLEYALQSKAAFVDADPFKTVPVQFQLQAHKDMGVKEVGQQFVRLALKGKSYSFNIMVVGESGLGKSTFINTLFSTDLLQQQPMKIVNKTTHIENHVFELEENGVKLKLGLIDCPGFGDALNREQDLQPIVSYLEKQFEIFHQRESQGVFRYKPNDNRVHALLYFISPHCHSIKELDFHCLKVLSTKANVIPVIAKADTLTVEERQTLKTVIMEKLDKYDVKVYPKSFCDDREEVVGFEDLLPFAVIGANQVVQSSNGKQVRARKYKWGVVEVENETNCDFVQLRQLLLSSCLHDLTETTSSVHYFNYRMGKLRALGRPVSLLKSDEEFEDQIMDTKKRYQMEMSKKEEEMRMAFFQKVKEKESELKAKEESILKKERELLAELEAERKQLDAEEREIEMAVQRQAAASKRSGK
ncbi:hypothetical protein MIR68_009584 [Amoeboaphelidium protococcarum]|nr:hypothetical protein MIR68_009584 [Amoeboaphelidium protococcarum]